MATPPLTLPQSNKGGYRPKAGRPKGSGLGKYVRKEQKAQGKLSSGHAMQVLLNGETPLEVLITAMRVHYYRATRKAGKVIPEADYDTDHLKNAAVYANMAAPYCHPRLATHELSGKGGGAIPLEMSGSVTVYVPDNKRRNA